MTKMVKKEKVCEEKENVDLMTTDKGRTKKMG